MVEGTGLENRQAGNRLVGSNPTPSATRRSSSHDAALRTVPFVSCKNSRGPRGHVNKIVFNATVSMFLAWQAGYVTTAYAQHGTISESDSICRAIADRLSVMKDVAAYKYAQGLPIETRDRENEVIERFSSAVQLENLPKDYVENIIVDQIEAAKLVQTNYIAGWKNGRFPVEPQNAPLSVIRTQIDEINSRLIDSLAAGLQNETCPCPKPDAYSGEIWRKATRTLTSNCQ